MRAFALNLIGLSLATTTSSAQELIHAIDGKEKWMVFGFAVDGIGDITGDGKEDFIVGEPDGFHQLSGRATVFSGSDGKVLQVKSQGVTEDRVGYAVTGIGDADFDGVPDYAVGAPRGAVETLNGVVWILSGADGSAIHTLLGPLNGFGERLSAIGDFDGDGAGDLLVRTPLGGAMGIEVRSGGTGQVLQLFVSTTSNGSFGDALSGAGDTNGDGFLDIVVGDPIENGGGSAAVYSGFDAQVRYKLWGDAQNDLFGNSVAGLGDVNGDGFADLVVGAPENDSQDSLAGLVRVHSGVDGAELYRIAGIEKVNLFGTSVAAASDLDLDGVPDFLASSPNIVTPSGYGAISAFSGSDGSRIFDAIGPFQGECFGCALATADVDGDGYDDLIVGSPYDDTNGTDSGFVRVFSGRCGQIVPYGTGCAAALQPVPQLNGAPACSALPGNTVSLSITNGLGGAPAVVLLGAGETSLPLGFGCLLHVWPVFPIPFPVALGGTGTGNGNVTISAAIPSSMPLVIVTLQAFVADPVAPLGYSATNGLRVSVQ